MKRETVEAWTEKEALKKCPYACVAVQVPSGKEGVRAWMCFESITDYEIHLMQT